MNSTINSAMNSAKPALTARRATRDDLPFLAWCNIEAKLEYSRARKLF